MLIARGPNRPGQRRIGTRPRSQLQGLTGFSASNYYRSAAASGGPQGSTSMTVCAFVRMTTAAPSVIQTLVARLGAASGGFSLNVVNSTGYARVQVIDGATATASASNSGLPALVNTDVMVHGVLTGGQLVCYVNGTASSPTAVTGYTAPGTLRLGIGCNSNAGQPLDSGQIYGVAICDATGLSAAQVAAHVYACQRARELVQPDGCTYLWHGEDGLQMRSTWEPRIGSWSSVALTGTLSSVRKLPTYG